MPKIKDLGIKVIPETMRPPQMTDGGCAVSGCGDSGCGATCGQCTNNTNCGNCTHVTCGCSLPTNCICTAQLTVVCTCTQHPQSIVVCYGCTRFITCNGCSVLRSIWCGNAHWLRAGQPNLHREHRHRSDHRARRTIQPRRHCGLEGTAPAAARRPRGAREDACTQDSRRDRRPREGNSGGARAAQAAAERSEVAHVRPIRFPLHSPWCATILRDAALAHKAGGPPLCRRRSFPP